MDLGRLNDRGPATGNPYGGRPKQAVLPCHDRSPLSIPACEAVWRRAANLFYVSGFAGVPAAASCSGSAAIATEDSVTAARHVATQPIVNSGDALTGAISKVSKGGSIIETVSASIDGAASVCGWP